MPPIDRVAAQAGRAAAQVGRTAFSRIPVPIRRGSAASLSNLSTSAATTNRDSILQQEGDSRTHSAPVNAPHPYRPTSEYHLPHETHNASNTRPTIGSQIPQGIFRNASRLPNIGNLRQPQRPMRGGNPAIENNYYGDNGGGMDANGNMPGDPNYMPPVGGMGMPAMMQGETPRPLPPEQERHWNTLNKNTLHDALTDIFATDTPGTNHTAVERAMDLLQPNAQNKLKQIINNEPIEGTGGKRWGELGDDQKDLFKEYFKISLMSQNDKLMHTQTTNSIQEQADSVMSSIANSGSNRMAGQLQAIMMLSRKFDNLLSAGVG